MHSNVPTHHKKELDRVIAKRNYRLERFFLHLNIPVRLIGDLNTPAIIYKEMACLSAFVHNFELNFTDLPFDGKVVYTVKLTEKIFVTRDEILTVIRNNIHRATYNIKLIDNELFLAGYNFLDRKHARGKYPVFARHNYKIYFSQDYSQEIVDTYAKDGYKLEVLRPFLESKELKVQEYAENR